MKRVLKKLVDRLPYINGLAKELKLYKTKYPPGHFYSPIPAKEEVLQDEKRIFSILSKQIAGIDLQEEEQKDLLNKFIPYYKEFPFPENKKHEYRYYLNNINYFNSDAICLYNMIRYYKPSRIIEVGSGFSSALMLDINDLFFQKKIELSFIEPYPDRLFSLIDDNDKANHTILVKQIQKVDVDFFKKLSQNDILFIDSSHVSKVGSDLNYIIFDILPALKSGVIIHFHDIFYPFEYPKDWILKGRAWNENYLLKAFLQYNSQFEILFFNSFLEHYNKEWFLKYMPLCVENREGTATGSIWLKKL